MAADGGSDCDAGPSSCESCDGAATGRFRVDFGVGTGGGLVVRAFCAVEGAGGASSSASDGISSTVGRIQGREAGREAGRDEGRETGVDTSSWLPMESRRRRRRYLATDDNRREINNARKGQGEERGEPPINGYDSRCVRKHEAGTGRAEGRTGRSTTDSESRQGSPHAGGLRPQRLRAVLCDAIHLRYTGDGGGGGVVRDEASNGLLVQLCGEHPPGNVTGDELPKTPHWPEILPGLQIQRLKGVDGPDSVANAHYE